MADRRSDSPGSWLGNLPAWLAALTVLGGLWLVSQKLTSSRPVVSAQGTHTFFGDQKHEARLWEDPFKVDAHDDKSGHTIDCDLETLLAQVSVRNTPAAPAEKILLLPVMVSGGNYSEDRESRIRSRFAIVSALGRAGYAPEDAEHIGAFHVPWPESHLLRQLAPPRPGFTPAARPTSQASAPPPPDRPMRVSYEWYYRRNFIPGNDAPAHPHVLVLWIDDTSFEDFPLLRLALFLHPFTQPSDHLRGPPPRIALLGPRRSSTLRNMLPRWSHASPSPAREPDALDPFVRDVLAHVDLYSATASAMDEALIEDFDEPSSSRSPVNVALRKQGFASVHNFAATDAQLAREIFNELKLRGVRVAGSANQQPDHIVLLSEWDTFYGRLLSLTYQLELARNLPGFSSPRHFIHDYRSGRDVLPKNFRAFVYLRGLDGQTLGPGDDAADSPASSTKDNALDPRRSQLRQWTPDVNKAEGRAQLDYLARMGDRIAQLESDLSRDGAGKIKAIGIVGGDVYDTLLILQALRKRFSHLLFFTTDLDVRFLHPREHSWARNLIVASSYGLTLHPDLQDGIAPFRDSLQTAQFAAALAALRPDKLPAPPSISPRRFEIGNNVAVDLSAHEEVAQPAGVRLHPLTESERHLQRPHAISGRALAGVGAVLLGLLCTLYAAGGLTINPWTHPCAALRYTVEDVGDSDGAIELLRRAHNAPSSTPPQTLADAYTQQLKACAPLHGWITELNSIDEKLARLEPPPTSDLARERSRLLRERDQFHTDIASALVRWLNDHLDAAPPPHSPRFASADDTPQLAMLRKLPFSRDVVARVERRYALDQMLDRLSHAHRPDLGHTPETSPRFTVRLAAERFLQTLTDPIQPPRRMLDAEGDALPALRAAITARESTERIFHQRCRWVVVRFGACLVFGAAFLSLVNWIWLDTFVRPEGEPFSLTAGVSAWPAQLVRFTAFALAVVLTVRLVYLLREVRYEETRKFRLSPPLDRPTPANEPPTDEACVQTLWWEYRASSRFHHRWWRVTLFVATYFALLFAIHIAFGESALRPLRGAELLSLNISLVLLSVLGFLFLAGATADAARQCRVFIEKLGGRRTTYPEATRRYFSRIRGDINEAYLDEWIDVQLIANLTERIGRLVYFPAGLLLLLLLARTSWWDNWSWPPSLVLTYLLNFVLALASVIILQHAAKRAKREAEESLAEKVKRIAARNAPSADANDASQAEKLLEEIRGLRRGAFVPFWENPVVGAIFVSSGGTTLLQLLIWFVGT
jgi:hypothetical protein